MNNFTTNDKMINTMVSEPQPPPQPDPSLKPVLDKLAAQINISAPIQNQGNLQIGKSINTGGVAINGPNIIQNSPQQNNINSIANKQIVGETPQIPRKTVPPLRTATSTQPAITAREVTHQALHTPFPQPAQTPPISTTDLRTTPIPTHETIASDRFAGLSAEEIMELPDESSISVDFNAFMNGKTVKINQLITLWDTVDPAGKQKILEILNGIFTTDINPEEKNLRPVKFTKQEMSQKGLIYSLKSTVLDSLTGIYEKTDSSFKSTPGTPDELIKEIIRDKRFFGTVYLNLDTRSADLLSFGFRTGFEPQLTKLKLSLLNFINRAYGLDSSLIYSYAINTLAKDGISQETSVELQQERFGLLNQFVKNQREKVVQDLKQNPDLLQNYYDSVKTPTAQNAGAFAELVKTLYNLPQSVDALASGIGITQPDQKQKLSDKMWELAQEEGFSLQELKLLNTNIQSILTVEPPSPASMLTQEGKEEFKRFEIVKKEFFSSSKDPNTNVLAARLLKMMEITQGFAFEKDKLTLSDTQRKFAQNIIKVLQAIDLSS